MFYSHPATKQDEWVLSKQQIGTFVELGAYDGLTHSNTLALEERGWRGTLIEGHLEFARKCEKNRPKANVRQEVIGDGEYRTYVVGGQYSGLVNNMPDLFLAEHTKRNNERYVVRTKRLSEVIGTRPIDYVSLDTEGGEYDILKQWLEDGGRCNLLTVEFRYEYEQIFHYDELLGCHGMVLDEVRGFDLCYMRK